MVKGRFAADLPQSGLPGLRFRRDTETWVVNLPVPKELRGVIHNAKGRPLTRLERSTGERELERARRAYPAAYNALLAELQARSLASGAKESRQQSITRAVGEIYKEFVDDPKALTTATRFAKTQATAANRPSRNSVRNQLKINPHSEEPIATTNKPQNTEKLLAQILIHKEGVNVDGKELELATRSVIAALCEAGKYGERILELGYLAEETDTGRQLRHAADKPQPISLWEVAQHKIGRNNLSESARQAHEYAVRAWSKIVKRNSLDDLTTKNINSFLEILVAKGWNGKPLSPGSANSMAINLVSLLKHQTYRDGIERTTPIYQKIQTDRRIEKLKHRDKAAKPEDIRQALDYAYLHERDRYRWLWLLLVNNTTLRVSESLQLKWGNLIESGSAWFFDLTFSKTAEGIRYVPLNDRLEKWLLPLRGADDEYVIDNSWPRMRTPKDGPGNWTRSLAKKLKIQGRINPHAFRHAAGGDLTYESPEGLKKKLMGHAGGMTDLYSKEDLKKLRAAANYIGIDWSPPEPQPQD